MPDPVLTKEQITAAFEAGDSVVDGTFYYWMNPATKTIAGTCSEGTCDMQYDDVEEFLRHTEIKYLSIR